jgi:undecaprenyl-diphosphatase
MEFPVLGDSSQWLGGFVEKVPWLTVPIIFLTAISIFAEPTVVIWIWFQKRGLHSVVTVLASVLLTDVVCHIVSHLAYVDRPFVKLHFTPLFPHSTNTSFPSSTTAFAFAAALAIWSYSRKVGACLLAGSVMIGFGCVYVGVHWVADVLAGCLIGLTCAALVRLALLIGALDRILTRLDDVAQSHHLRPMV